ncbi:carbohydrate kinase [Stutzerimonas nosocomialis]|uniref:carbohydrate kinase family protein n=1 Tax=Stutzerimonas nosocomialis TaxID=1056496 RepID=UPI001108349A|nr:carbohydrate kinase [Stutzerimonas nosocomialis]TLX53933.1 carbohydrate kinase [Stutzerimonas nosocomialis]
MYLVCGEALFDVFAGAAAPERCNRLTLEAVAGGSPFNVAVGLSRLGVPVAFLAGLSNDPLGRQLRQVLTQEQVDARYLLEFDAPTTLAMVAVGPDGSPQYSFRGEGCADRLLREEHLPALDERIRGIHVGSFSLVVQPVADTISSLVERECGQRLISLDPNVRLNVEPSLAIWRERIEHLARQAHLIKVSLEDLEVLYPDRNPEDVARSWLTDHCQLVVLTRGADGAQAFSRGVGMLQGPARPVQLRDTVGAGDTFQAAMLAFLHERRLDRPDALAGLDRETLVQMLAFAMEAAAITCSRTGPDLPYRRELAVLEQPPGNQG